MTAVEIMSELRRCEENLENPSYEVILAVAEYTDTPVSVILKETMLAMWNVL